MWRIFMRMKHNGDCRCVLQHAYIPELISITTALADTQRGYYNLQETYCHQNKYETT